MGFRQAIALAATCAAMAVSANAAPPEPLVVSRLSDPDPNFVPLPAESGQGRKFRLGDGGSPALEAAMQDFGRAIGQAALVEQQQIDARCRAGETTNATAEQRFAWQASCRYTRH